MEKQNYRILHMLDRPLKEIEFLLPEIEKSGFNVVQISPLQKCKTSKNDEWWLLYQPLGFEIGNRIGTKKDLEDLCREARKHNIIIVADAVINHVGNKSGEEPLVPHPDTDIELLSDRDCFKERKQIDDWEDRYKVINYCMGLPGLNPNHPLVQQKIIDMLNSYISLGVESFRFDAAKSIGLPSEGCDFFPKVLDSLSKWLSLVYGEVLFADPGLIKNYSEFMKVLTNSYYPEFSDIISYSESSDSFLSDDLGYTKNVPMNDIIGSYSNLASNHPHTSFYARPGCDWAWKSERVSRANKQYVKVK